MEEKPTSENATTSPSKDASLPLEKPKGNKYDSHETTKRHLDKLFSRIDKPIQLPERKEKSLRPPREFFTNVPGSSAGAGSGDFHLYRSFRRREYARTKIMEEDMKKEMEQQAFEEKLKRTRQEEEEKTAKKRAKRLKRKQHKKGKTDTSNSEPPKAMENNDFNEENSKEASEEAKET